MLYAYSVNPLQYLEFCYKINFVMGLKFQRCS